MVKRDEAVPSHNAMRLAHAKNLVWRQGAKHEVTPASLIDSLKRTLVQLPYLLKFFLRRVGQAQELHRGDDTNGIDQKNPDFSYDFTRGGKHGANVGGKAKDVF